jgi:hypothetical protein
MIKNTLIFAFVLLSVICYGQRPSSKSIKWNVSQLKDLKTDTVQNYVSHFITDGLNKVVWVQNKREDTFFVNGSKDNWSDLKAAGQIEYDLDVEGGNGNLRVVRDGEMVEIILALTNAAGEQLEYKFSVESFELL